MRSRWLFVLPALLALTACGGKEPIAPPMPRAAPSADPSRVTWQAQPNGLRLHIEAAPDLNQQDGKPLALSLCVYQLDKSDGFNGIAQTPGGLNALQECTIKAADAISARRFWLQPGQKLTTDMDRAEGARLLAVAAGYAHLKPELSRVILPFLLHQEKSGYIPFFRDTLYSAAEMEISIHLSSTQVSLNGVERVKP